MLKHHILSLHARLHIYTLVLVCGKLTGNKSPFNNEGFVTWHIVSSLQNLRFLVETEKKLFVNRYKAKMASEI